MANLENSGKFSLSVYPRQISQATPLQRLATLACLCGSPYKRKSFLFAERDWGGRMVAIPHSFVGSCKGLGTDPFAFLREMLERLQTDPADQLSNPLPEA